MKTILLIDDDKNELDTLQIVLEAEGYRVLPALDPLASLDYITENHVDIMVTSFSIPNVHNWNFKENLLVSKKFNPLPIILFSSYSADNYVISVIPGKHVAKFNYSIDNISQAVNTLLSKT